MTDITFTFNSYDLSGKLSTYNVFHEVEVADTMTALDGTEHVATRVRPSITFTLLPMSSTDVAAVYAALKVITAEANYTDPNLGTTNLATMRVTTPLSAVFGLKSVDGNVYYKGGEITMRQRTVL